MGANVDRAMESLRELARDLTTAAQEKSQPPVPTSSVVTLTELLAMPVSSAFVSVRAGLRNARRALEAQLALARDDEPDVRARRFGIIWASLVELAESEARLDIAERTLAVSLHARR
jgi:hypothetical protein